jgi:hypothetical protein
MNSLRCSRVGMKCRTRAAGGEALADESLDRRAARGAPVPGERAQGQRGIEADPRQCIVTISASSFHSGFAI